MINWSEMTAIQKLVYVTGLVCTMGSLVLSILRCCNVLGTSPWVHLFPSFFCFSMGFVQRSRKDRIFWYIFASVFVLFFLLYLFIH